MRKSNFLPVVILLVAAVLVIVSFIAFMPPRAAEPSITVSYSPPPATATPTVALKADGDAPAPTAAQDALASVGMEGGAEDGVTVAADSLQLHIQDAMGNAIARGRIAMGTEAAEFTNGSFTILEPCPSSIRVKISAPGYTTVEKDIDAASRTEDIIVMEYLSNYELRVRDVSGIRTAPGARVRIWKASTPIRPIGSQAHLSTGVYNTHAKQPVLAY